MKTYGNPLRKLYSVSDREISMELCRRLGYEFLYVPICSEPNFIFVPNDTSYTKEYLNILAIIKKLGNL